MAYSGDCAYDLRWVSVDSSVDCVVSGKYGFVSVEDAVSDVSGGCV